MCTLTRTPGSGWHRKCRLGDRLDIAASTSAVVAGHGAGEPSYSVLPGALAAAVSSARVQPVGSMVKVPCLSMVRASAWSRHAASTPDLLRGHCNQRAYRH